MSDTATYTLERNKRAVISADCMSDDYEKLTISGYNEDIVFKGHGAGTKMMSGPLDKVTIIGQPTTLTFTFEYSVDGPDGPFSAARDVIDHVGRKVTVTTDLRSMDDSGAGIMARVVADG